MPARKSISYFIAKEGTPPEVYEAFCKSLDSPESIKRSERRAQQAENRRQLRAERMAKGYCVRCNKPNLDNPGTERCVACREKENAHAKRARKEKKLANCCSKCGVPLDSETESPTHKSMCLNCAEAQVESLRQLRAKRKANRECVHCGVSLTVEVEGFDCVECVLKATALHWMGTSTKWEELKELLEKQDHKSIYTGRVIQVTREATVDHKIPRSRGGTGDIENLQWIEFQINLSKSDMTHKEYLEHCCLVADRYRAGLIPD